MKILTLPALAAALALAACADNDADDAAMTDDTAEVDTVAVPATSETTVVREVEGDADSGDRVRIGEDGVTADVGDEDTRVRADIDRDPSLEVETD